MVLLLEEPLKGGGWQVLRYFILLFTALLQPPRIIYRSLHLPPARHINTYGLIHVPPYRV